MRKERPHISVVRSRAEKQIEDFPGRSKALKNSMKYLGRPEFAKIEKAMKLLDQCIEKAWNLHKKSPDYVPIPDEEIDAMFDAIYKEYGIEVNSKSSGTPEKLG